MDGTLIDLIDSFPSTNVHQRSHQFSEWYRVRIRIPGLQQKSTDSAFLPALLSAINENEVMRDIKETVVVVQDMQIADFLVDVEDRSETEEDTKTFVAVFYHNSDNC